MYVYGITEIVRLTYSLLTSKATFSVTKFKSALMLYDIKDFVFFPSSKFLLDHTEFTIKSLDINLALKIVGI